MAGFELHSRTLYEIVMTILTGIKELNKYPIWDRYRYDEVVKFIGAECGFSYFLVLSA